MALANILVIIDPLASEHPNFERAIQSAVITGAALHLVLCMTDRARASIQGDVEPDSQAQAQLAQLTQQAEGQGVSVSSELLNDNDWSSAYIGAATRIGSDMIFKSSHYHSGAERASENTSDWHLMREAPCPVLMVKNFRDWRARKVLAAVKLSNTDDSHDRLNRSIVNLTQKMATAYGSDAHFVAAYEDKRNLPEMEEIVSVCGTDNDYIHLLAGNPCDAILRQEKDLAPDLLVLGTVARKGIVGRVVGNTSEKILDQTEADVLVISA